MYTPPHFELEDPALIRSFIEDNSFALLCIADADGPPQGVHIPLLIDGELNGGRLLGHVARANPIWRSFSGQSALAVFTGEHGYISPRWYLNATNVPTWNYSAVHISGVPRIIEDESALVPYMQRLIEFNEAPLGEPQWRLEQAEPAYLAALWQGFVLFEMPIAALQAKFKLSQNRRSEDYEGAVRGLEAQGSESALRLARLMREHNSGRRSGGV